MNLSEFFQSKIFFYIDLTRSSLGAPHRRFLNFLRSLEMYENENDSSKTASTNEVARLQTFVLKGGVS